MESRAVFSLSAVLLVALVGAASDECFKGSGTKLFCYFGKATDVRNGCKCSHIILPADADVKAIDGIRTKFESTKLLLTVNEFNEGLVNTLKKTKVDGLEINLKKLSSREDIADFVSTVRSKLGNDLYIALSVPAKPEVLAKYYDFKTLSKTADVFLLQTAFLGASKNVTFHPSRLSGLWDVQNTDSVVDLVSGMGAPLSKLVVSAPVQAFKFTLQNDGHTAPGSPALEISTIDRDELCEIMGGKEKWTLERDQDQAGPYIFREKQWIAFEDSISMDIKAKYSRVRGLAGLALKDVSQDGGSKCGDSLLHSALNGLSRQSRAPRGAVLHSLEREILETPTKRLDNVQLSPYRISRVIDVEGKVHIIRQDTRTEFECSRQGYFVHPRSCGRFYRCVKFDQLSDEFSVFEFDCPAGLAFDPTVEVCVWPGSLPHASACSGSSEIAPVPKQRFVCPSDPGYYADPENCRWFFACLDHGKSPLSAYEFRCPYGLVFDGERLLCEWPWLVPKCGSGAASGIYTEEYEGRGGEYSLDLYDGLGSLKALRLGGLSGPLSQPISKTFSSFKKGDYQSLLLGTYQNDGNKGFSTLQANNQLGLGQNLKIYNENAGAAFVGTSGNYDQSLNAAGAYSGNRHNGASSSSYQNIQAGSGLSGSSKLDQSLNAAGAYSGNRHSGASSSSYQNIQAGSGLSGSSKLDLSLNTAGAYSGNRHSGASSSSYQNIQAGSGLSGSSKFDQSLNSAGAYSSNSHSGASSSSYQNIQAGSGLSGSSKFDQSLNTAGAYSGNRHSGGSSSSYQNIQAGNGLSGSSKFSISSGNFKTQSGSSSGNYQAGDHYDQSLITAGAHSDNRHSGASSSSYQNIQAGNGQSGSSKFSITSGDYKTQSDSSSGNYQAGANTYSSSSSGAYQHNANSEGNTFGSSLSSGNLEYTANAGNQLVGVGIVSSGGASEEILSGNSGVVVNHGQTELSGAGLAIAGNNVIGQSGVVNHGQSKISGADLAIAGNYGLKTDVSSGENSGSYQINTNLGSQYSGADTSSSSYAHSSNSGNNAGAIISAGNLELGSDSSSESYQHSSSTGNQFAQSGGSSGSYQHSSSAGNQLTQSGGSSGSYQYSSSTGNQLAQSGGSSGSYLHSSSAGNQLAQSGGTSGSYQHISSAGNQLAQSKGSSGSYQYSSSTGNQLAQSEGSSGSYQHSSSAGAQLSQSGLSSGSYQYNSAAENQFAQSGSSSGSYQHSSSSGNHYSGSGSNSGSYEYNNGAASGSSSSSYQQNSNSGGHLSGLSSGSFEGGVKLVDGKQGADLVVNHVQTGETVGNTFVSGGSNYQSGNQYEENSHFDASSFNGNFGAKTYSDAESSSFQYNSKNQNSNLQDSQFIQTFGATAGAKSSSDSAKIDIVGGGYSGVGTIATNVASINNLGYTNIESSIPTVTSVPLPQTEFGVYKGGVVANLPNLQYKLEHPTTINQHLSTYKTPAINIKNVFLATTPATVVSEGYSYPKPSIAFVEGTTPKPNLRAYLPAAQKSYVQPLKPSGQLKAAVVENYSYQKPAQIVTHGFEQQKVIYEQQPIKPAVLSTYTYKQPVVQTFAHQPAQSYSYQQTHVQNTGYQYKQPKTTYQEVKQEGYHYEKPTIAFEEKPIAVQPVVTYQHIRKPVVIKKKLVQTKQEGYHYEKPTIAFEEKPVVQTYYQKPIVQQTIIEKVQPVKPAVVYQENYHYEQPKVAVQPTISYHQQEGYHYEKPTIAFEEKPAVQKTPAVSYQQVHHKVQPVVQQEVKIEKQEGYHYEKPTIAFEEKPVVHTYQKPIVQVQEKIVQPAVTYQEINIHKQEGYHYEKPKIAFEEKPVVVQQPAVTYQQINIQKPAVTYEQVHIQKPIQTVTYQQPAVTFQQVHKEDKVIEGYHYEKPKVTFEEKPVVHSYSFQKPAVVEHKQVYVQPAVVEQKIVQPAVTYQHINIAKPKVQPVTYQQVHLQQEEGYHYEKPAVAFEEKPVVHTYSYQKPAVVQQKVQHVIQEKVVVQPTISYQEIKKEEGYHYEKPKIAFEEKPAVQIYTYQKPAVVQQTIVQKVQPVVQSVQPIEPAVTYQEIKFHTPTVQKVKVNQEGYHYEKPAIAFEERPTYKQVLTQTIRPVISSFSIQQPTQKTIIAQAKPAQVSTYTYHHQEHKPVKTYLPAPTPTYLPAPTPTYLPVEPKQIYLPVTPKQTYIPVTPKETYFPVTPKQTYLPVTPKQTYLPVQKPKQVYLPQPTQEYLPIPQPTKEYLPVQPVIKQKKVITYEYPKPSVETYSYESRQPVVEELIVPKKAYVTGTHEGYNYPKPTIKFEEGRSTPRPTYSSTVAAIVAKIEPANLQEYHYYDSRFQNNAEAKIQSNVQHNYETQSIVQTPIIESPVQQTVEFYEAPKQSKPISRFEFSSFDSQYNQPAVVSTYELPQQEYLPVSTTYRTPVRKIFRRPVTSTEQYIEVTTPSREYLPVTQDIVKISEPTREYLPATTRKPSREYLPVTRTPSREYLPVTTRRPSKEYLPVTTRRPSKEYLPVTTRRPSKEYLPVTTRRPSKEYLPVTTAEPSKEYLPITPRKPNRQYVPAITRKPSREYLPVTTVPSREYLPVDKEIENYNNEEIFVKVTPTNVYLPVSSEIPSKEYLPVTSKEPSREYLPVTSEKPSREYLPVSSEVPSREYLPGVEVESYIATRRPKVKVLKSKAIVKVNDFHPVLAAKLGAQCTCVSNTLKLRKKPSYEKTTRNQDLEEYVLDKTTRNGDLEEYIVDKTRNGDDEYVGDKTGVVVERYEAEDDEEVVRSTPATKKSRRPQNGKSIKEEIKSAVKEGVREALATKDFDRYGPGGLRSRDETLQGTVDCQRAGLFRHPKHCNKFYTCRWDETKKKFTLHVFNCPVHLTFDNNLGACNWPSQGPACVDNTLLPSD